MFKIFCLTAIIISLNKSDIHGNCRSGCLRCNLETKECELCDFERNYFMKNGRCVLKSRLRYCEIQLFHDKCTKCFDGHYYLKNGVCNSINEHRIDNCVEYDTDKMCKRCVKQYYYSSTYKKCILLENQIKHCTAYDVNQKCIQCISGYHPNATSNICVKLNFPDKCKKPEPFFRCTSCEGGIGLNTDYPIFSIKEFLFYSITSTFHREKCLNYKPISNCAIYKSHNTCELCKAGYYFSEGSCIEYIGSNIHCQTYSKMNKCSVCKNGFYLVDGTCEISLNNGCLEMVDNACIKCDTEYFSNKGVCQYRTLVENCAKYVDDTDNCLTCEDNFILLNNECYTYNQIDNCKSYQLVVDKVVCASCEDYYYLNTDTFVCEKGEIDNCKSYFSVDVCHKCDEGYSLSNNGLCNSSIIQNCIEGEDICNICDTGYSLVKIAGHCELASESEGYYESNILIKCNNPDYSIVQDECVQTNANCLRGSYLLDNFICSVCNPGYYLFKGSCIENIEQVSKNCIIPGNENKCEKCEMYHKFKPLNIKYICTPNSEACIEYNSSSICIACAQGFYIDGGICKPVSEISPISNCKIYSYENCIVCEDGYMRSADGAFCVVRNNNCEIFKEEQGQIFCLTCIDNYARVIYNLAATTDVLTGHENRVAIYSKMPFAQCRQAIDCFTNFGQSISECDIASKKQFADENGVISDYYCCESCRGIKTGINIFDTNNKTFVPSCEDIESCNPEFKFTLVGRQNTLLASIKCNKCDKVNNEESTLIYSKVAGELKEICAVRTIPHCLIATKNDDETIQCKICDSTYKLDPTGICIAFNCLASKKPNLCDLCKYDYVLSTDFRDCLPTSANIFSSPLDPNCKRVDSFNTFECIECREGYSLNAYKICENIKISFCGAYNNSSCMICDEGFGLWRIEDSIQLYECLEEASIPHCLYYDIDDKCTECEEGYNLDKEGFGCYKNRHCGLYNSTKNICERCHAGYYMNENQRCVKGYIKNCKTYLDANKCEECEKGYQLSKLENDNVICSIQVFIENCSALNLDDNYQVICKQCKKGYIWKDALTTVCSKYDLVYSECTNIDPLTFKCKKCVNNFYNDNGTCVERAHVTTNCIKPSETRDFCDECRTGFVLDLLSDICIPKKRLPNNCLKRFTNGKCQICSPNYLLTTQGDCIKIEDEHIEFCETYNKNFECTSCKHNFVLLNNRCIFKQQYTLFKLNRCVEFNDSMECIKCIENYYLENGICKNIIKHNTANCDLFNDDGKCRKCNQGYYRDALSGQCHRFSTEYFIKQHVFDYGYDIIDTAMIHCDSIVYDTMNIECQICESGYYVKDGLCIKCPIEIDNCEICNGSKCLFCKSRYYMTYEGKCEESNIYIIRSNAIKIIIFILIWVQ